MSKVSGKTPLTRKISQIARPEELSLEEWQIRIRKQIAQDEKFVIRNIGSQPVFSTFQVSNPKTDKVYRVEIRGENPGINYCSCPDFSINTLGTCKHIEYVLNKLRQKKEAKKILTTGYIPDHSSVTLRYGLKREIVFSPGHKAGKDLQELIQKYFDKNLVLTQNGFALFPEFIKLAAALPEEVHYHPDAMEYIANVRDMQDREERVRKMFPDGTKNKVFDTLLKADLYPYQKEGAIFALKTGRCLIADEMGLGKTIQAIAASELMARCFGVEKVLIICPTSLKHQWQSEIDRFTNRRALVINGMSAQRAELYVQESFFKIVNYDVIHRDFQVINNWSPDLIILDEAQRIKNWQTRLARTIKRLSSPYAIILTGTPLENRLEELHSIIEFIDRYRLGPLFRFLHNHQITDGSAKVTGYRNLNELGKTLSPILIRRKKKEVLPNIPERIDKNYFVPMTPEQNNIHEENRLVVARIVNKWKRYKFLSETDKHRLMISLQYMRMASDDAYLVDPNKRSGNKIKELEIQLSELFEYPGIKVVIFSQWVRMLELVVEMLSARDYQYVWLHGGVPGDKRGELIRRFNEDNSCRIFLSTEAGGVGLNLQKASVVINLDLPWNPAVLEQRIARVHRFGQQDRVRVINYITENSIEHGMLSLIKFKQSMFTGVLDDGEDKVFMKDGRFNQFMRTVESAAAEMEKESVSSRELSEAEADNSASRENAGGENVLAGASLGEIFQAGAVFLDKLAKQFKGENRPESLNTGIPGIKINTDEQTGKKMLQIALPEKETLEKLAQAFLSCFTSAGKDG